MGIAGDLRPYLQSPDGDVRGLAVRGLLLLGDRMEGRNVTFSSRIGIASRSTPGMASSPAPSPTSFDRGGRERNSLAVTMEPAGPITAGPASEE